MESKLNSNYYAYPNRPKKVKHVCSSCGNHFYYFQNTPNFCAECGKPLKEKMKKAKIAYKNKMDSYHKRCKTVNEEFKKDALEYYGIADHLKADIAFDIAWQRGHSNGFNSVFEELEELVKLLV